MSKINNMIVKISNSHEREKEKYNNMIKNEKVLIKAIQMQIMPYMKIDFNKTIFSKLPETKTVTWCNIHENSTANSIGYGGLTPLMVSTASSAITSVINSPINFEVINSTILTIHIFTLNKEDILEQIIEKYRSHYEDKYLLRINYYDCGSTDKSLEIAKQLLPDRNIFKITSADEILNYKYLNNITYSDWSIITFCEYFVELNDDLKAGNLNDVTYRYILFNVYPVIANSTEPDLSDINIDNISMIGNSYEPSYGICINNLKVKNVYFNFKENMWYVQWNNNRETQLIKKNDNNLNKILLYKFLGLKYLIKQQDILMNTENCVFSYPTVSESIQAFLNVKKNEQHISNLNVIKE